MVRVSLALGIIATIAGLMAIGFGIPIQAFGLGNTLIVAGSTVFSAGLIVIALSLVLRAIDRLAQDLHRPVSVEPTGTRASLEPQPVALSPPASRSLPPTERLAAELPNTPAPVTPPPHEELAHAERLEPRRPPLPARSGGWQDESAETAQRPAMRPPGAPPLREAPPAPPLQREASIRARLQARTERPAREAVKDRPPSSPEQELRREPVLPSGPKENSERELRDPYAPPERRRVFGWTRRSKDRGDDIAANGGPEAEPEFGAPPSATARAPQAAADNRDMPRLPLRGASPEPRELPPAAPPVSAAAPPAPPRERPTSPPPVSEPVPHPVPTPNGVEEAPAVEILKQGTVDGMAYTLYTDGSIDAEFPDGKIRFNSIDELRQHLEAQQS